MTDHLQPAPVDDPFLTGAQKVIINGVVLSPEDASKRMRETAERARAWWDSTRMFFPVTCPDGGSMNRMDDP